MWEIREICSVAFIKYVQIYIVFLSSSLKTITELGSSNKTATTKRAFHTYSQLTKLLF